VDDLSLWAQLSIIAGAAVLGPAVTLLLALLIGLVLQRTGTPDGPPALAFVVADFIGRSLRRTLHGFVHVARRSSRKEAQAEVTVSKSARLTEPAASKVF
jgi:hypothetical protein